jgi:hypothetical protein
LRNRHCKIHYYENYIIITQKKRKNEKQRNKREKEKTSLFLFSTKENNEAKIKKPKEYRRKK